MDATERDALIKTLQAAMDRMHVPRKRGRAHYLASIVGSDPDLVQSWLYGKNDELDLVMLLYAEILSSANDVDWKDQPVVAEQSDPIDSVSWLRATRIVKLAMASDTGQLDNTEFSWRVASVYSSICRKPHSDSELPQLLNSVRVAVDLARVSGD